MNLIKKHYAWANGVIQAESMSMAVQRTHSMTKIKKVSIFLWKALFRWQQTVEVGEIASAIDVLCMTNESFSF